MWLFLAKAMGCGALLAMALLCAAEAVNVFRQRVWGWGTASAAFAMLCFALFSVAMHFAWGG